MKIVTQFLRDVDWGPLDYFLVDLPPGTGDAQLSLVQATHVSGALIVTTPQEMAVGDALRGAEDVRAGRRAGARHRREHERVRRSRERPPLRAVLLRRRTPAGRRARRGSAGQRSAAAPARRAGRRRPADPGRRAGERAPPPSSSASPTSSSGRPPAAPPPCRSCAADGRTAPMSLITLLTDFGTADSYVAEVKGVLLSCGSRRRRWWTSPTRSRRATCAPAPTCWDAPGTASRRGRSISPWWIPASAPTAPRSR